MAYDFTTIIHRKDQGSHKWGQMYQKIPFLSEDIVPFSVADMEFVTAPEIIKGLQHALDVMNLGYTDPTPSYYRAVQNWMERHHNYRPDTAWIVESPGVVPAIYQMVRIFTQPEEKVLIQTPAYHPFRDACAKAGRGIVESSLMIDGDSYKIDWDDLSQKLADPKTTLMIVCNPHNPIGKVWSKTDIQGMADLCLENNVFMISDEIHSDLILPGHVMTSVGELGCKYIHNAAICTAPTKTFNIAGMQVSNIIVENEGKRELMGETKGYFALNVLSYTACEIAYNECDSWLEELLRVIEKNHHVVKDFFAKNFPETHVFDLEGTYLQWLDLRNLGIKPEEMQDFLINKAKLFFSNGIDFGKENKGFERMNVGCPTWVVKEGLSRLKTAMEER